MAATFGSIEEFDGNKEEWPQYVERLGHYFEANSIEDADKKRAVFLSVVGPATYKILRNLFAPDKVGDKTFAECVNVLTRHFNPVPSEIVERCKFHSRFRRAGESVSTFVAELRRLSEFCNFGEVLEDMIRDRLVCGIRDDAIQKRLLSESKLTYDKAVEIALNQEQAAQNMRELKFKRDSAAPTDYGPRQEVYKVAGSSAQSDLTCFRCGKKGHVAVKCRVSKTVVCRQCGKRGHLQKACRSSRKVSGESKPKSVMRIEEEDSEAETGDSAILQVKVNAVSGSPPIVVKMQVEDCLISMEVDTGASMTLMSEVTFKRLWPGRSLGNTPVRLCTYVGEPIPVLGLCYVNVVYQGQKFSQLPMVVVQGAGPTLLGRNWLMQVKLDWQAIHSVHYCSSDLQAVLDRHSRVFQEGLGTLKGFEAKIYIDPQAQPKFYRARPIPYALRDKVFQELQRLQDEGTLEPVEMSDWAAPMVPVLKSDKTSVRICGDFRLTVNPVSKLDSYPIPKVEDLFARLAKGRYFSKLDLSQAYQQLPLAEESKQLVVINTPKGLFRFTRLPYGISSAPGIFQRVIEGLLQGVEGVVVYLDDILITGATKEDHLVTLEEVLNRLDKVGLRVKRKKCEFLKESVGYLGHKIDALGLHPLADKVQAIKDAPTPRSLQELRSYLGILTYYGKFLPNLSSVLSPLYNLLRKDVPWHWGPKQAEAFRASKELLTSEKFLAHFDSSLKLTLACDASSVGIGAVLAHKMPDGTERPIGYASRTLTKAESNYAQLEKEALSCVWGVKKFHDYVFGHAFDLVTDHKPLLGLLKEDRVMSPQASARIKRWLLFLSGYEYSLQFRCTSAHANADALSRLPLPVEPATTEPPPELVLLAEHLADSPVTASDIRIWTKRDPTLAKVLQFVQQGWPSESAPELNAFRAKQLELSLDQGCILWGSRVVIPSQGREAVLHELHEGHPGTTRMKSLARMYVWWPGIDSDIEKSVQLCPQCQQVQPKPPVAPLNPWKWPTRPWARLHIDFAGPFLGKTFLIVIDAHSKWIEAICTGSTSSNVVIEELRTMFAKFGLPETVVTDNGTGFTSHEFNSFLKRNGIKHITSAPYHPSSNGLAERAVQIVKQGLKKVSSGSMNTRLARVLLSYRITPQATTGVAPAELLLGRRPRTRLDLCKPHTAERVEGRQLQQKVGHDKKARARDLCVGDAVLVRNFGAGQKWLLGEIFEKTGPVSYRVRLENGDRRRCHLDQLRLRQVSADGQGASEFADSSDSVGGDSDVPSFSSSPECEAVSTESTEPQSQTQDRTQDTNSPSSQASVRTDSSSSPMVQSETTVHKYPRRDRRPRTIFDPSMT